MSEQERAESLLVPYRVLDLTQGGCLVCGRILGDLGADVLKIEKPGGDPSRNTGPFYKDIPDSQKSLFWFAYNANKRGITLNIETADGKELFKKLVKTADFVVESFLPGYMDELGLGYTALSEINPRLVMTSITSFGQSGPKAHYKASDLTAWASGGALYVAGDPDRPPTWISFPQACLHGGAEAAAASMIAHWHREMTGEGQHVDVSIQQCVVWVMMAVTARWDLSKMIYPRTGSLGAISKDVMIQGVFPCKDGYIVAMILGGGYPGYVASSKALVAWMDEEMKVPDWLRNFDWATEYDPTRVTQEVVDRVQALIAEFFLTKTKTELYEGAISRNIRLSPVSDVKDVVENKQLNARKFWEKVNHPELDEALTYCGPFIKLSKAPIGIHRRAPLIGEHNLEIYVEELGLSKEELILLKQARVI